MDRVRALRDGKVFPFTVIMQDKIVAANSSLDRGATFIGPRLAVLAHLGGGRGTSRPNLTVEDYDRTFDEDEELGLNDINDGTLDAVAEEGSDDDLPAVDGLELGPKRVVGVADHVRPAPRTTVDHPNPEFARGCDDALRRGVASACGAS